MNKQLEYKIVGLTSLMAIYLEVKGETEVTNRFNDEIIELRSIKTNKNKYTYVGTNYQINKICKSMYYKTFQFEERCIEYSSKIKEYRNYIKKPVLNWLQKFLSFSKNKISFIWFGLIGAAIAYLYPLLFYMILGDNTDDKIILVAGAIFGSLIIRFSIIAILFLIIRLHILVLKTIDSLRPIKLSF